MVNTSLNAVIVDNDLESASLLKEYIHKTNHVELAGSYHDIDNALNHSSFLKPEIIYVDIHMSGLREYNNLARISNLCKHLIIVSHETKYAIEGYRYNVYDYLMKPLSYESFSRSFNKLMSNSQLTDADDMELIAAANGAGTASSDLSMNIYEEEEYVWIKCDKKIYRMWKQDIHLVEGLKDYIVIHHKGKKYVTHLSMSLVETYLGRKHFIRINRSCIISKNSIIAISGNVIETTLNKQMVIGIRYREKVRMLYAGFRT